ncbi:MAG: hypothetical protein RBT84_11105 [FCB group bacterium]|nr:hypothetical protein [FCB group bacterium]
MTMARPDELVMLRAVSKLKDYVVFAWTSKGDLWHIMSPMALVPPWGEYYPRLCTREQFEKLALVDVSLEQTQGGRALASNSYSYGGHFVHSLRLGTGAPISFTAGVSPESEFVRLEFYCRDESQPFLTADNIKVDMRWYQDTNAVARVVTRPKDEYKLILETKVADPDDPSDPDTPGHDCPGYVVVEGARGIYHGPMRYYPKDGWVRLRPVANPGYRFVKWETSEDVTGAVLGWFGVRTDKDINGLEDERIAVCMQADTTLTAVFEFAPNPTIVREIGALTPFSESEEDQALLTRAGFDPETDDLSRWLKTEATPGEIFKLTITSPNAAAMIDMGASWVWEHFGDHIEDIQETDSITWHLFDVCYVECKSEYVPENPSIGILRIRASGSGRVLKTIVVDNAPVTEYPLRVGVHENVGVTSAMVQSWLEHGTNQILLLDEKQPNGGNVCDRYQSKEDVNCAVALTLYSFSIFNDNCVGQEAFPDQFKIIENEYEYKCLTSDWDVDQADVIVVEAIQWHPELSPGMICSFADKGGYGVPNRRMYISSVLNGGGQHNFVHESGHYIGSLDDMYFCSDNPRTPAVERFCGQNPCICRCPNNKSRNECTCGFAFGSFLPDPKHPLNLMGNDPNGRSILDTNPDQKGSLELP